MSRYIDADALLNELKEELEIDSPMLNEVENKWVNKGIRIAIKDVKRFPTANVVEVVRCKDCVFAKQDYLISGLCLCEKTIHDYIKGEVPRNTLMDENDYCNYGERSENGKS